MGQRRVPIDKVDFVSGEKVSEIWKYKDPFLASAHCPKRHLEFSRCPQDALREILEFVAGTRRNIK